MFLLYEYENPVMAVFFNCWHVKPLAWFMCVCSAERVYHKGKVFIKYRVILNYCRDFNDL
jgi:hypothetical protein